MTDTAKFYRCSTPQEAQSLLGGGVVRGIYWARNPEDEENYLKMCERGQNDPSQYAIVHL